MKKLISQISCPIKAKIQIPGSKSLTNRALLLAALSDGTSVLSGILISDDTEAFMSALRSLGIMIQCNRKARTCIVIGCNGTFPVQKAQIDCNDAGTAARFLLAACAANNGVYTFTGSAQLCRRPMSGLIDVLRRQGIEFESEDDHLPLVLTSADGLPGGSFKVDAAASGQYVSALLMAAPLARSAVTVIAHDPVSRPFIDMTAELMGVFGVRVRYLHAGRFSVPVPQQYVACDYTIEPDLSTAACFFAAAAVTRGEVTIQSFDLEESTQGDAKFLRLLQKMGCEVIPHVAGLTVRCTQDLVGISVDMRDCSDTFMALAAVAPFASSRTTITNIGHTRKQESDRIMSMCRGFAKLGVRTEQGDDWLRIYPGSPHFGEVDACNDHRIAMAFAVVGLRSGVEIIGAECVAKTCPAFFTMWNDLISNRGEE